MDFEKSDAKVFDSSDASRRPDSSAKNTEVIGFIVRSPLFEISRCEQLDAVVYDKS
jgi:hypothetical protein